MEDQNKFTLNDLAVEALRESAKWCMFLAIVGFMLPPKAGLLSGIAAMATPIKAPIITINQIGRAHV